jgi:hypothetical protein
MECLLEEFALVSHSGNKVLQEGERSGATTPRPISPTSPRMLQGDSATLNSDAKSPFIDENTIRASVSSISTNSAPMMPEPPSYEDTMAEPSRNRVTVASRFKAFFMRRRLSSHSADNHPIDNQTAQSQPIELSDRARQRLELIRDNKTTSQVLDFLLKDASEEERTEIAKSHQASEKLLDDLAKTATTPALRSALLENPRTPFSAFVTLAKSSENDNERLIILKRSKLPLTELKTFAATGNVEVRLAVLKLLKKYELDQHSSRLDQYKDVFNTLVTNATTPEERKVILAGC